MWFWWFMLICCLMIPGLMIIAGWMMWKHCPKQINSLLGYRTKRSMKNMDTWKFAHEYCGRLWFRLGLLLLIPLILLYLPFYQSDENTIGIIGIVIMTALCAVLCLSILPTEAALKKTFNDNGPRK